MSGSQFAQSRSQSQVQSSASMASVTESANDGAVRELCTRRIQSIVYLKRTLEGRQSWLNTVRLSKRDLSAAFDTEKMKKRSIRNMYLGLSLGPLIEMSNINDLCKTIVNLFAELESWSENVDKDRNKVVRSLFRTTRGSKRLAAAGSVEFMGAEAPNLLPNEHTYLLTPNLPFAPDYFHTFFTLADMLQEVYYKILILVAASSKSGSASAFNPSTTSSFSTVGSSSASSSTSPVSKIGRGVSGSLSLSQSQLSTPVENDLDNEFGRLLGVSSGPPSSYRDGGISNGTLDLIMKVDGRLKKILIQTAKEVDALARHLMKEEMTTLELQVRNLPNSSGSTALAPGANLAGVSSPVIGGERSAFDAPSRSPLSQGFLQGPILDRGSTTPVTLSGLMSPTNGTPPISREASSQGYAPGTSPNFPSSRPVDPGLPQNGFRSPPGWVLAPPMSAPPAPPPVPPPLPPQAPPSGPSPRSLFRRKSSGKIIVQAQAGGSSSSSSGSSSAAPGQPQSSMPPLPSLAQSPPPPSQAVEDASIAQAGLSGVGAGGGGGIGSGGGSVLPVRHGKTPSFSATSSGFEPGALTFVPTHSALMAGFGRGRGRAGAGGLGGGGEPVLVVGADGTSSTLPAGGGGGLKRGSKEANEGFHPALISGANEFGALTNDSAAESLLATAPLVSTGLERE